jgi:hypothetical protein
MPRRQCNSPLRKTFNWLMQSRSAEDSLRVGLVPVVGLIPRTRLVLDLAFLNSQVAASKPQPLNTMLFTIAIILLVLWGLGLVTSVAVGGFIHILLVIAIIMVLVGFFRGRRVS